jgi:hypothetical protein
VALTKYPVNCSKTNWLSGQAWAAWYEVAGCCTPETLDFDYDDGFVSLTGTLERDPDSCEYYTWTDGTFTASLFWDDIGYGTYPCSPSNPDYPAGWTFDIFDASSYSILYGVNENATDRCDPVATYYELFSCPRDTGWRAIVTLPTP